MPTAIFKFASGYLYTKNGIGFKSAGWNVAIYSRRKRAMPDLDVQKNMPFIQR